MTKKEILYYLTQNKEYFFQRFGIVKMGLFGSYSRGEAREDSDIDILIELDKNTKNIYKNKRILKNELEQHFQKRVDIAREKYLRPLARETIMEDITYVQ